MRQMQKIYTFISLQGKHRILELRWENRARDSNTCAHLSTKLWEFVNRIRVNLEKITSGVDREEARPDIEFRSKSLNIYTHTHTLCTHASDLVPFVLFAGFYSRPSFLFRGTKRKIRVSRSSAWIVFPAISRDRYRRCSKVTVVDLCARRSIEKVNRRIYRVREKMTSLSRHHTICYPVQSATVESNSDVFFDNNWFYRNLAFYHRTWFLCFYTKFFTINWILTRVISDTVLILRVKRNVSFST